jgi:hypothetical protein
VGQDTATAGKFGGFSAVIRLGGPQGAGKNPLFLSLRRENIETFDSFPHGHPGG